MSYHNIFNPRKRTVIAEKITDNTIPGRLEAIVNSPDAAERDKSFANSLLGGWNKYGSLTLNQNVALMKMEQRYNPETKKASEDWYNSFDEYKRSILKVCARYYIQTPYFYDIAKKAVDNPEWIPTEKQYRAMCENKYAKRLIENVSTDAIYKPGDLVEFRNTYKPFDLPKNAIAMIVSVGDVLNSTKGSREYKIIIFGQSESMNTMEKHIKLHRRK